MGREDEKSGGGGKTSEKISVAIADGVPNLKAISGKLKVLVAAAEGNRFEHYELVGLWDITKTTLEESIEELNEIIGDIEKEFYGAEGWR